MHQKMLLFLLLLLQGFLLTTAQTLSDCHNHGNVEYCVGADGEDTPVRTMPPATTASSLPTSAPASTTASAAISQVTDCHLHATQTFCMGPGDAEYQVTGTFTADPPPAQFTGCHAHGSDIYCLDPVGGEVQVLTEAHEEHNEPEHKPSGIPSGGENCHFHAGVEHCTGGSGGESEHGGSAPSCGRRDREYNIPLRIGSLFVVLVTSSIAVFGPILLARIFTKSVNTWFFTVIKQFGAGVMMATAFIHLFTHATLMFGNPCLGELQYESTTGAIAMAGIFITFLLEYLGNRAVGFKRTKNPVSTTSTPPETKDDGEPVVARTPALIDLGHHSHHVDDVLSVMVMEAGIIFHSVIIGVTLIVAGDSAYISLLIVIIFHQAFEGLALGSRIAELAQTSLRSKLLMALAFALITPLGMAIGLGVINTFNGNDRNTIIAMGTLDALSAGILTWAALVDMLSHDWVHGDMKDAPPMRTAIGMFSLVTGMVLMGLLGKWA